MALRNIRTEGDEVLTRKCREVKEMTPRLKELVNDMLETMYDAEGVGLAAPQVGVLRRIVVIDVGEDPIVLVNPVITAQDGEQTGAEGCLSVPGKAGQVTRPNHVVVRAVDADMQPVTEEAAAADESALRLEATWVPKESATGSFVKSDIAVYAGSGQDPVYTLDTGVYVREEDER